ncbi:MAG: hypothetical protein KatS3mg026_0758 [Bacteroidia bacterium]|nr:MAG: hypothetical protein KatS3mg026_0758 [Bacteroidia bacterium]
MVAQAALPCLREGFLWPTRDTVYLLVVFAEVDYGPCGGHDPYEAIYGRPWPVGPEGRTQVPLDAHRLLDAYLGPTATPQGILTATYWEASFGQFVVLGDYWPEVVRVPCHRLPARGTYSLAEEVELVLQAWPEGPFRTARGVTWQAFDRWQLLPQQAGLPKKRTPPSPGPDYKSRLDGLFILWRNLAYRLGAKPPFSCNYGFGLWSCDVKTPLGPFTGGIETASSYTTCQTAEGAAIGFLVEFFHGLYGGNHWHTAGGAGLHTFPFVPVARGLSVQGARPVYAIGYDRWIMDWKAPGKTYAISALDERGQEVPTDLTQPARPETLRVWLRDFLSTGDAIRIRLPYTERGGPQVKNQYLWLENRRFRSPREVALGSFLPGCPDNPFPDYPRGLPGLYAYIQVGKDKLCGSDIYSAHPAHPNGLGSWIFPVTAEGNYDFAFRQDSAGRWLMDRSRSLPNPFTGQNDLYLGVDLDGNGRVDPGAEGVLLGYREWRGDTAANTCFGWGDWEDGFSGLTQRRLSLETNPAPVPVYTLLSSEGYQGPSSARPAAYDNRTIWLSGLAIEIVAERPEDGALLVEVRWNDRTIRRPVRWCGHLRLPVNPFSPQEPALRVRRTTVTLDWGESPTYGTALRYDSLGKRYLLSDTTVWVVDSGAVLALERGRLHLRRGSRLVLLSGARLEGEGELRLEPGCLLEVAPGALIGPRIRIRNR